MAKSSFSRRQFLKASALSSGAMALSSCASVDRFFMGDSRNLRKEVIILGGGAAGLAAAFELKRRKVPFRIFEASSRMGGRVQSVRPFSAGGPVAELGAEFFTSTHTDVFRLAKELNLPVKEIKPETGKQTHLFSFAGKTYQPSDLQNRLRSLQAPLRRIRSDLFNAQDVTLSYKNSFQFERSSYYDSLSLQALLDSWKSEVDPVILKLIEVQAVNRYGVDAKDQSSLHFISTLDGEGSSLLAGRPTFRLEGGLSELMQTLSARASGVIPDYAVKMNSELIEISEALGVFELTFKTPQGTEVFYTENIICTIPFSKLKEVKGIFDISISELKKENIRQQEYASHSKGIATFKTPFWRNSFGGTPANLGNFTGDFTSQKIWDSGRSQAGAQGLLTYQRGGSSGLATGAGVLMELQSDLGLFYKSPPLADDATAQMINWKMRKWSLGSMAYFKPGQYMRFKGVAAEIEYGGKFYFAGEHTSLGHAGTLQGALETGRAAGAGIQI